MYNMNEGEYNIMISQAAILFYIIFHCFVLMFRNAMKKKWLENNGSQINNHCLMLQIILFIEFCQQVFTPVTGRNVVNIIERTSKMCHHILTLNFNNNFVRKITNYFKIYNTREMSSKKL